MNSEGEELFTINTPLFVAEQNSSLQQNPDNV